MRVVGIIAEYNPFHNGHAYQLAKAKELTGADYAVVVLSGDFVQRGTPAVFDKYIRTKAALLGGADVVFELPVLYATGSAEYFAEGAIRLLDSLGIVDTVCFGSESGDIHAIRQAAEVLNNETDRFKETLRTALASGDSFPLARQKACAEQLGASCDQLLSEPNNLLGIEYFRALLRYHSTMSAATIKRSDSGYHSQLQNGSGYCSASAVRAVFESGQLSLPEQLQTLSGQLPSEVLQLYEQELSVCPPMTSDALSTLLSYRLLFLTPEQLCNYLDWNPDTANRLFSVFHPGMRFSELSLALKSKQLTLTRTNRMLLHVLLGITAAQAKAARSGGTAFYARLTGFRAASSEFLRRLTDASAIPVINRLAPGAAKLSGIGRELLQQDIQAAELYRVLQQEKSGRTLPNEYVRGVLRL